ncbi:NAD-dependent succinate-semialdehyde dehydrogenase [Lysinibacter sp. HNR]|uniref:NAD-dependent succinate-semialdehyde dehydrogenase n=1 Tax=Lysinibacter sp. HNR TaxID=3031408 RepID=UPI002434B74B|nr:NAD-dependent succinate-semialdehyde dehydrogenase [Lysinibacter sp. HNR]WGD36642.1 NAD-dependent succinate-semialdehyde dehydrogenase [Lysinibacter sp. HNR]
MSNYAVINPATGEKIAEYPTATDAQIQEAISAAHGAQKNWEKGHTLAQRTAIISRVADLYIERREVLATIIVREMGKPIEQARGEVDFVADIYRYYADNAEEFLRDEPIEPAGGGSAFIRKSALGSLLGIMPWNFPYYQVARFAGPNLILGNTIVLKHAPQCPESALAIVQIFKDAGLPEGAYVNIFATNEQVADIIADPRIQGVSLTGSERAGSAVAELAGRHLKKIVLELGGSDALIVLSTDNIDEAVGMAVAGRLENSGQACNASKRILVMDHLYEEFADKFATALAEVTPEDPTHEDTVLGPLSSDLASERLQGQIERALAQGAVAKIGGPARNGNFVPTTLLTNITPENDAYREEFFGPVASLYRVTSEEDAVRVANDSPFGLGAVVITTDQEQALRVADALEVGMVFINEVGGDSAELPFGGVKRSGVGRELGPLGIDEFVNKKLIRNKGAH